MTHIVAHRVAGFWLLSNICCPATGSANRNRMLTFLRTAGDSDSTSPFDL